MQEIINLNKKIYNKKAIHSSIKAFENLASFNMREKGNYFIVKMDNMDKEVEKRLKDEFCNFVLAENKNGK